MKGEACFCVEFFVHCVVVGENRSVSEQRRRRQQEVGVSQKFTYSLLLFSKEFYINLTVILFIVVN